MPPAAKAKPRTRLDPELRQSQILDHAARLIDEHGLAGFSMERVAKEAGISKALVYAYFANQTALLQALLLREMRRIQREQLNAAEATKAFPDMVRKTTHIALCEVESRGTFIQRLLSEPSVAAAMGSARANEHSANVSYLARRIAVAYGIALSDALPIAEIGLGLSHAAGDYLKRTDASREEIEELTSAMIIGAVRAAATLKARKPRRKRRD